MRSVGVIGPSALHSVYVHTHSISTHDQDDYACASVTGFHCTPDNQPHRHDHNEHATVQLELLNQIKTVSQHNINTMLCACNTYTNQVLFKQQQYFLIIFYQLHSSCGILNLKHAHIPGCQY